MAINIEMNFLNETGSYEVLYPKTLGSLVEGKVNSASNADTAASAITSNNCIGNSATATKLQTSRSLKVNLNSASSQSFNGSVDATSIGISGVLPVGYGGTGTTSYSSLASYLNSYLSTGCSIYTTTYIGTGQSKTQWIGYTFNNVPKVCFCVPIVTQSSSTQGPEFEYSVFMPINPTQTGDNNTYRSYGVGASGIINAGALLADYYSPRKLIRVSHWWNLTSLTYFLAVLY